MNLHGFERDFTTDLEAFVRKSETWAPIEPLAVWSPRKTAAPERHRLLGFTQGVSLQTQIHLLDTHNEAFEIMESMVRLYLSPIEYGMLGTDQNGFAPLDKDAEQVWLFALRWLTHYYECLMEPLAIRTEFYQQSNGKFLDLMTKMLQYNPKKRISFHDALLSWYPTSSVFLTPPMPLDNHSTIDPSLPEQEVNLDEHCNHDLSGSAAPVAAQEDTKEVSSDECHSHDHAEPVVTSVTVPAAPAVPAAPSAPSLMRRLALKRPDGPAGRNKTRRSPRNPGRSPAIGNRGTRARG